MPIPQLTYKTNKKLQSPQRRNYRYRGDFKRRGKKSFKWRAFIFLLKVFAIASVLGAISFAGLIWYFSRDLPTTDKLIERDVAQSTKIYDRTGKAVLYDIHGEEKRTMISLDDIPKYAKEATITAEDRSFYSHHGFNLKGIARAVIVNMIKGDLYGQGGSTITQQLVKNAILTSEKTYSRKLKELVLSYRIENTYSKDDILKMYLNEIPYGSTVYGIEAAAQTFFGKKAGELTLAEAAALASLPRATTYYSPYGNHKDKLIERQHYILDSMAEENYISKEEAGAAKTEELKFKALEENIIAPHFVMYIKDILAEKYGEKFMEQGGLKVYTTLDLDKQKKAEDAIKNGFEKVKEFNGSNAAMAALDPKTGQILAMVGSKNYFDIENEGNFNVALSPRQPGSSFKPIVYTALLARGYTPETILFDTVTNFKPKNVEGKDYIPHNYDNKEHGPVSVRTALQGSLNIPAVKALYLAGVDNVLELAKKLGYTTLNERDRFGLSLVLGGGEVKLLEHTAAYGILAREGVSHPTTAILKVEDKDGRVIEEYQDKEEVVLNAETVRKMNDILSDDNARAYVFGTGGILTLKGRPVCVKTGTTNDYKDAWTIGYTPSLVAGVWVGNNNNTEMKRGADGSIVAAPIWNEFMKNALGPAAGQDHTQVEEFKKPAEDKAQKVMLNGSSIQEIKVKIDKVSGKLANNFCPESYIEEQTFNSLHSILYYIDKNNPRGDFPQNPASDPQFEGWESAVLEWAKNQKDLNLTVPPEEKCFLHNLENKPIINIIYPGNNDTITSDNIEISINATAPRGINRIDYYIDGLLVQTVSAYPFGLKYPAEKVANGFHNIKATAYDDVGNNNAASIDINIMASRKPISFLWISPQINHGLYPSAFPLSFNIQISDPFNAQNIKIWMREGNGEAKIINSFTSENIHGNNLEFSWGENPSAGDYGFYAEAIDKENRYSRSEEMRITVIK
ncbi:MAG: penicillin-binding protein [bacterium]